VEPKEFDVAIVCSTGGKSLEQLLDFPVTPDSADNGNEPEMRHNVFTRDSNQSRKSLRTNREFFRRVGAMLHAERLTPLSLRYPAA
jgi:hypothetical protein